METTDTKTALLDSPAREPASLPHILDLRESMLTFLPDGPSRGLGIEVPTAIPTQRWRWRVSGDDRIRCVRENIS